MPDMNGKLSEQEKQTIWNWVDAKSGQRLECPICRTKRWTIADHVVAPSVTNAVNVGMGVYIHPQALLVSVDCGYTMYLNLIAVGIMPRQEW